MTDQVIGITIKGIGDFSDVVSNVGSVQKALTKLKLPDKLGDSLNKNISNFMKEYDKYQKKIAEGIHTQSDQNAVNKSLNSMLNSYEKIVNEFGKLSKKDFKDIFNLDDSVFASVQKRIKDIQTEIKKIKIDSKQLTGPMAEIAKMTSAKAVIGNGKGLDKLQAGIDARDFTLMKEAIVELEAYYDRFSSKMSEPKRLAMKEEIEKLKTPIEAAIQATNHLEKEAKELDKQFEDIGGGASRELNNVVNELDKTKVGASNVVAELKKVHEEEFSFNREAQNIDRQIQSYFGLSQMIRKVGDIARDAFATVKELDKAMTETAVVTNFSVGDMWEMLPTYTAQANQLGSTIRDVYEAATLYYQQGLNTNQAMSLANETLKMARIAGLDATDATNMMTAALRGFNMEINQTSAQKINDVYSELAAITASDTKEIGSAMERTASIADSANMEFETTSAFLAQMIETTREAPENLGTAMKTIVARFQEMKQDPTKLVDSEGVAMNANKVDAALKTIGVDLMNAKGEFRDLDDVFLDISSRWDSLTQGQQRYIATMAAGSRQQSRFIAMMSNYERTMELVDAANNSAGASQRQFEKTLDSMEAKLNKLKNAWDQFTMGLMNNQILKFGVSALTEGFTIINKIIDTLGKLPPSPFEGITKSALTLVTTLGMLNFGKKASRGLVMAGAGWWKGEGKFGKNFSEGWGGKNQEKTVKAPLQKLQTGTIGQQKGIEFANRFKSGLKIGGLSNAVQQELASSKINAVPTPTNILPYKNVASEYYKSIEKQFTDPKQQQQIKQQMGGIFFDVMTGKLSGDKLGIAAQSRLGLDVSEIQEGMRSIDGLSSSFTNLGVSISNAGNFLVGFGSTIGGTFGNTLVTIGSVISTLGASLVSLATESTFATASLSALGGASWFSLTGVKALGAGVKALWAEFLASPLAPIVAALAAIAAISYTVYKVATRDARALQQVQDAAAAASEAYDSAKQETSELSDAIEQIKSNEDAFDGLVVGTAAFNEQLVNANEQIMELVKKYPMLNDSQYLSTDKNGLMHLTDEGLEKVKEYQKQRQANASALNAIQTADLNEEESHQKAEQMRKVRGTDTTETYDQRLKEADLLEQQAKAQTEIAKQTAVNTALVDKEINNREKISAIMADQYDDRKKAINLEGESIHDLKQEYADFYGYKYDKSTKKLTDVEGNEIDVDKSTVEDAVKDIRLLTDLEVDAKSLDNIINSIDSKFTEALGEDFQDAGHLFSDILSDNIEADENLLQKIIENPNQLKEAVNQLSEKEIAAVLGVSVEAVEQAPDKYTNELTNKLTEKATNIAETQAKTYSELAGMMAQTIGKSSIDAMGEVVADVSAADEQLIKQQLSALTAEQKNILSTAGKGLLENVGSDSMSRFIKKATDIYINKSADTQEQLTSIVDKVNWSSPTSRLKAYNDMLNSSSNSVQKLGKSLLNSTDSANLLGEAFEEFYDSNDFQELAENMDNFVDSSGQLNASSVQEMAKECSSLNNLLDTGAISAGGVAAALNAMGNAGSLTVLDLNENLLKFLSTANQLQDVLAEAHSLIENFDWGVDTGESEDFAKDSTKKWKELYDNGEFGNQQLENYTKFVLGQDKWNEALEESGGDIEEALDSLSSKILKYSDGFEQAWIDMANSGAEKYQDVHWKDGDIIWDTNGKTTQELVDWLAETRGITQEWAKLMVEDFANYSYDFKTELQNNDFTAALKNGDYIEAHKGQDNTTNITQSELTALAAAQNKTEDEILKDIQKYGNISEDELNVIKNIDENGNALMGTGDIASFNTQYSQAELGKNTTDSWISQYVAKNAQGEKIEGSTELKSAISGAIADGFLNEQANEMARTEALKALEDGAQVFYDGVELHKEDLEDSQVFAEKIAEITENSRWNAVGEAIAQGYINYIKGVETPNSSKNPQVKNPSTSKDSNNDYEPDPFTEEQEQAYSRGGEKVKEVFHKVWQGLKDGINSANPTEDPKNIAKKKAQKDYQNWKKGLKEAAINQKNGETIDPEVSANIQKKMGSIWKAVKKAFLEEPNIDIDPKTNGSNKQSKGEETNTTEAQGNLSITYIGKIANPDELKTSLQQQIASLLETITAQQSKLSATATVNVKQGTIEKPKTQKAIVNYAKGKQAKASNQTVAVDYKLGTQAPPKPKNAVVNYTLGTQANPKPKTVDISPHFVGSWEKTVKLKPSEAQGRNNKIKSSSLPNFGSLAKGSRYGRVGPQGKGGLTLTGEKGFEIAWLPSESKSMIVGANGPQMLNLPSDAVIYTHEQSKKILKQKSIPAGSHAGRHVDTGSNSGSGSGSGSRGGGSNNRSHNTPAVNKVSEVIITTSGKVFSWWEKISRQVKGAERQAKSLGDKTTKIFNDLRASIDDVNKVNQQFIKAQQNIITLNTSIADNSTTKLNTLNKGTKEDASVKADIKEAKKDYKEAKKDYKKKKTKKNKKKLKKAKKKLSKVEKKALGVGVNWQSVEWQQTKKTTDKKGKVKKTKITKKESINLSKYIKIDENGNYYVDKKEIDKLGKKNKAKAKAVQKAAYEQIDKYQNRKNDAEDKITNAQDELAKYRKDIDNAFFGWKNELTQIARITSEIERSEAKINSIKAKQDRTQFFLDNLDLSFGTNKTGAGLNKYFKQFASQTEDNVKTNNQINKLRQEQIAENKKEMRAMGELTDDIVSYEGINGKVKRESEKALYNRIEKIDKNGSGTGWDELSEQEKKIYARNKAFQSGIIKGNSEDGYYLDKEGLSAYLQEIKDGEIQEELGTLVKEVWDDLNDKTLENLNLNTEIYNTETENLQLNKEYLDLAKQISDQLYGWQNSLTKVLELSNKIEQSEKRLNYLKSANELYEKRMLSGKSVSSIDVITAYTGQMIDAVTEIQDVSSKLDEQRNDLQSYLSGEDISKQIDNLSKKAPTEANLARLEELKKELEIRDLALQYGNVTRNADGTVSATYDSARIEKELGSAFDAETAQKMEDFFKEISDRSSEIRDTMQTSVDKITELYQELIDLKKAYADEAEKLLNAYINIKQKEIDSQKTLYNSIDSSFKELISDVKQTLQIARQVEDNTRTEKELSKKQQRLSMLQADTSGGNQVEIAKLQQEIADSKQSYGRTLEDQLLDRISTQQDIAARQRQRQIELLQAQHDISKAIGIYARNVDEWLQNPDGYANTIKNILLQDAKLQSLTSPEQEVRENELNTTLSNLKTYLEKINAGEEASKQIEPNVAGDKNGKGGVNQEVLNTVGTGVANAAEKTVEAFKNVGGTVTTVVDKAVEVASNVVEGTVTGITKAVEGTAAGIAKGLGTVGSLFSKAIKGVIDKAEKTAKDLEPKREYKLEEVNPTPITGEKKEENTSPGAHTRAESMKESNLKAGEKILEEKEKQAAKQRLTELQNQLPQLQKELDSLNSKKQKAHNSSQMAKSEYDKADRKYKSTDPSNIKAYQESRRLRLSAESTKNARENDYNNAVKDYNNKQKEVTKVQKEIDDLKKKYGYATGGLATQTGLAWLDGTPAKPELVLNAQDTKNFLALKDVLDKAIGASNSIANDYGANSTFEININVDHINNDYDVDRIAARVKKDIVKSAGYRNVTQVRNFR